MERARQRSQVALFAIDEAHCVSQWGHDFRREYQQLKLLHEGFPGIPRIALTATAEQRTREEIVAQLDLGMAARFMRSFDRPNIRYTISEGNSPRDRLWRFIDREHAGAAGIACCLSRHKVEQVADWLCGKGRVALPYHAGLPAQFGSSLLRNIDAGWLGEYRGLPSRHWVYWVFLASSLPLWVNDELKPSLKQSGYSVQLGLTGYTHPPDTIKRVMGGVMCLR